MKLQQLRYLLAIAENGLNITAASEKLYTSQPGVSKQLKLLEEELGLRLFSRNGKSLDGVTYAGNLVLEKANAIMREVENIKQLAKELRNEQNGSLSIGTTHTQARYVLPEILSTFQKRYPEVSVNIHQGTSEQIAELLNTGKVDFAIASGTDSHMPDLVTLPCYQWDRAILVPNDHPLAKKEQITIRDLADYPIVTYNSSFDHESSLSRAFKAAGLKPNIAITARDADVIKTYVRKGLGIGIAASMSYDAIEDNDLTAISTDGILKRCTTWIGFREDQYLRSFTYDFIELFAPHQNRYEVNDAIDRFRNRHISNETSTTEIPYRDLQPKADSQLAA